MISRIAIRPYCLEDSSPLLEAALESVHEVSPWLEWCHHGLTLDAVRSWVQGQIEARQAETEFEFVIEGCHGEYLGGVGLNSIMPGQFVANLSYWVRTSAARRGIAVEAVRLLADWAFTHTKLNRLEIVVALGNYASERVAEKAGAIREGIQPGRLLLHGKQVDAVVFALTRRLWLET